MLLPIPSTVFIGLLLQTIYVNSCDLCSAGHEYTLKGGRAARKTSEFLSGTTVVK